MKRMTKLLTLAALLVAGQAVCSQAQGADVPELMRLLEQRKASPNTMIDMQNKQLQNAQLAQSDLSNANLSGSDFTDSFFTWANLTSTNFSNAKLTGSDFFGCIGFNSTILNSKTDFSKVRGLTGEQLAYARSKGVIKVPGKDESRFWSLRNTGAINMPNADLKYANLNGVRIPNANLAGADLTGASIRAHDWVSGALGSIASHAPDLTNVNLSGANLTESDLRFAGLTQTNLSGANLTKADLTGVDDFNTTILDNRTNFQGAIGLTPEQKAYARSKGAQNVPN